MTRTRIILISLLAFLAFAGQAQSQSTDTKDVQIARKKLRVGLDTSRYFTTIAQTINSASTHRMTPTAKAVYDAIILLGGGGGGGGGHIILDDDAAMDQRAGLNFISTPTVSAALTDDTANDETEVRLTVPNDAITANQIAANAVGNSEMADNAIGSAEIINGSVALADLADMATSSLYYRKTAGSGPPEVNTLATLKTDLGLTGTNSGDQTITLTGDVTGSGTGSFATTIADNSVDGTDIALGSDAQGDVMYYNGTDWVRLPAGTNGHYLQTQGTGANPQWASVSGGGGFYQIFRDQNVDTAQEEAANFVQTATVDWVLSQDAGNNETEITANIRQNSLTDFHIATDAIGTDELGPAAVEAANLAQMGAASGEVLKWNGTAWAPATDNTSGGAANYQTFRDNGTNETQRAAANFISSATVTATLTDDAANGETEISLTIPNDGVTATQIAADAVGSSEIAANAVGNSEMADNAIGSSEIINGSVALADLSDMATSSLYYRKTAGSGPPEVNTLATLKTDLGLTGTNSGDQTITLTGDVTGSGTGSFATTIADNSVDGTDIALGSDAQGDVMYYNGTDWVRLPAGTNGHYLQTQGTGANPQWAAVSGGGTNYQTFRDNGTNETQRAAANFISSATVTATLTDDAANGETEILLTVPNDGITATQIAADAVGSSEISANAVGNSEMADNAIGSAEIINGSVALADLSDMATSSLYYRKTAGSGPPEVNTLATLKTDLGLTGTNSGDQTITLTGDVTGSGTGLFATTIADNSVDGTDIALGSDAQGDVMYYNGTDWVRLPAGTNGHYLQTQGTGANPQWAAASGGGAFYQTARQNNTDRTQRGKFNFVNSSNTIATVTDDPANDESEVKFEVGVGAITATELATNSVNSTEITDGAVSTADIQDGAITNNKVTAGSLNPNRLAQAGALEGYVITWDDIDSQWEPRAVSAGDVNNLGNSFGIDFVIGSNDNNSVSLEQNNTRFFITGTDKNSLFLNTVAATNSSTDRINIRTNSTGTPAAGFGGTLLFSGESSTTEDQEMGRIGVVWQTATHATRTSNIVFSPINSGTSVEAFRIYGNQRAMVGGGTNQSSAAFQINSTTGGILPPKVTTTEMNNIATPTEGLSVYNTTEKGDFKYDGTAWRMSSHEAITGRSTGQTAAVASVATLTVGPTDASYTISGNINVTTSSAEAFSLSVDYTDETNTARNAIIPILRANTGAYISQTISATGAVPYPGGSIQIRAKASTAITIKTSGTFTGCTYNVEGSITRI